MKTVVGLLLVCLLLLQLTNAASLHEKEAAAAVRSKRHTIHWRFFNMVCGMFCASGCLADELCEPYRKLTLSSVTNTFVWAVSI